MNSIFTHPSGAQLFQGDIEDVRRLLRTKHPTLRVIGLFAHEHQPDDPSDHYTMIKLGYHDGYHLGPVMMSKTANIADHASDIIANKLREGISCLSSCAAGINRSGLVSALTAMKVLNIQPDEAIRMVREGRGEHWGMTALANPRFVEIVHQMKDRAGLKESWTVWQR